MKERNKSIDIAKGLLIISVVYFHMWTILWGSCELSHPIFDLLYSAHKTYCMFFMPAFFVITGLCSNFDSNFVDFIKSNAKSILIPMVSLNLIPCLLGHNKDALLYMVTLDNWLWGLSFWFLPVLFLSKTFFWLLHKLFGRQKYNLFIVSFISFFLSIVFTKYQIGINYWYWKAALADVFFIWVGFFIRNHTVPPKLELLSLIFYLSIVSLYLYYDLDRPNVGLGVHCTFSQIIPFLGIALSGTISILWLSRLIATCPLLEYIGRSSLVIYCSHWFIAQKIGKYLVYILQPEGSLKATAFYLLMIVLTLSVCVLYNWVLNRKYARWTLGRF